MQNKIYSGQWGKCHCQGIAVDTKREYIYYSFTTKLIKSDMQGNIIGSVDHIIGHLGCMDFNDGDGKVYASLEYKNDPIGRGILQNLGIEEENLQDGFYIAIFDVDKIDRMDMDAEKDGIMKTVYLKTVVDDFKGSVDHDGIVREHVHGCSGIDGLTIGPDFGADKDSRRFLHVCYGVYSDLERKDNDYQVILQYEIEDWWQDVAKPLSQNDMHKSGPAAPKNRYFLYTGNTNWGIQNLEYDEYTGDYIVCVYTGQKPQFPNYPMFVIDGSVAAKEETLLGCGGEKGLTLTLRDTGLSQNGIYGVDFPLGSMGFYALGNGEYYIVDPIWDDPNNLSVNVILYVLERKNGVWNFVRKAE